MLVNELEIKIGAGRPKCYHTGERRAGAVGPLLTCSWLVVLLVKCDVPSFGGLSTAARAHRRVTQTTELLHQKSTKLSEGCSDIEISSRDNQEFGVQRFH